MKKKRIYYIFVKYEIKNNGIVEHLVRSGIITMTILSLLFVARKTFHTINHKKGKISISTIK